MFATICLLIALVLFLVAAFMQPQPARPQLLPLGLAFATASLLAPLLAR